MDNHRSNDRRVGAAVSDFVKQLLALLLALSPVFILLPDPVWAQDSCVFYSDYNSVLYVSFPSSNFISGNFMVYLNDACQGDPSPGFNTGPMGYVHAPSQAAAASLCSGVHNNDMLAYRDFTKYSSQVIWWCMDPDAIPPSRGDGTNTSGGGPDGGGGPGADGDHDSTGPVPKTCETLVQTTSLKMTATYGLGSGIQCRRIGAGSIFDPAITNQGVQDAVDIYGYAEQGYQLCYPQTGKIIFFDAVTSPRAVVNVDYSQSGGFTCTSLNRAGTVVLVGTARGALSQAASAKMQVTTQYIRPGSYDSLRSAYSLINCTVTPSTTLRLRAGPWGRLLGRVWEGNTVPAKARTRSWYQISYKGQDGWIAAWLTTAEGGCFGAGPGHAALPTVAFAGNYAALLTGA